MPKYADRTEAIMSVYTADQLCNVSLDSAVVLVPTLRSLIYQRSYSRQCHTTTTALPHDKFTKTRWCQNRLLTRSTCV